jgi:uncharacterized phage infection (PIP) family protein YhgE
MLKRYSQFIKEADETVENKTTDSNKFTEFKEELKSMIEKTIEKSGGEYKSFLESFIKNPTDVKIEGLINDSDIYDFYLKWRNDIDEILNDSKFFDEVPSEINSFGLYDYMIKGTQRAIEEAVKMLSSV